MPASASENVASATPIHTTAESMPTAKRIRSDNEDECPKFRSENIVNEEPSKKHTEVNATFMIAEHVRSTGFGGDKFGEINMKETWRTEKTA